MGTSDRAIRINALRPFYLYTTTKAVELRNAVGEVFAVFPLSEIRAKERGEYVRDVLNGLAAQPGHKKQ